MRCRWRICSQLLSLGDGKQLFLAHLVGLMAGSSVMFSAAQSWFVTPPRGCWLRFPSLPGGNQVDGLPLAVSRCAYIRAATRTEIISVEVM